ncbi:MAG: hypothetical protein WAS28_15940 [Saprospiraceae bacterium]
MEHEKNIFNLLEQWPAPVAEIDLKDQIIATLNKRQSERKKFRWAWAAMIIVILVNIAVAVEVLEQSNDKTSNTYITYIETTHQELTSDATIQYP